MFIYHYLFTLVLKSPYGEWPITYTFTFTYNVDFLEIGGYVAKESVNDVAIGDNLSHEQRAEFMDLANEFQSLFTEAPGTTKIGRAHV